MASKSWPEDGLIIHNDVLPDLLRALVETAPEYKGLDFPDATPARSAEHLWRIACESYAASGDIALVSTSLLETALFIAFHIGQRSGRNFQIALNAERRKLRD